MKKLRIPILILGIAILSGCGSSVRIFTDVDESGRFDQYGTYNFLDFSDGNKKSVTQMELERIRVAFTRELEKRGLEYVEDSSDISVKITIYHREAKDHYLYHRGSYNYMERAIAVDVYDNQTRKHVWHGAAVGELDNDSAERAEEIPVIASTLFEEYPVHLPTEN